jgi:uncharacterized protein (TIGR04255 family)
VSAPPPLRLSKSPLVYVVAQIRFSAVESIAKYIPDIQDALRKRRFVRFDEGHITNVRLLPSGPELATVPKWEFQTREQDAGIVISKDAIALHVSRYPGFANFCDVLKMALDVTHSTVSLALVERIGLRYVDLVKPGPDEDLEQYLNPRILGLQDEAVCVRQMIASSMQYSGATDVGVLTVRVIQRASGPALPPDLETTPLKHVLPTFVPGERSCALDFDHYIELEKEAVDFSTAIVMDRINRLHAPMHDVFRAAVTAHALAAWE